MQHAGSNSLGIFVAVVLTLTVKALSAAAVANLPAVEVTADNTVISRSCRVVIPRGTVIKDADGNGVIQVGAPDIEIEFTDGSVLRGSPPETRPDVYQGFGVSLNGQAGVTIRGARVSGFWCGLHARKAEGLTLEGIDASDNRRAYLKSTPVAEDGGDWIFGHNNDQKEWLTNYAAAIYIEESAGVTVRNSRVWHGQNALCLDRVTGSKIYDNDFSFNSGWGIALWRCSSNVISRNAVDFCVRGYSHGVYNRGQDSAGIFAFEQNNQNVFAENSVTHGGDGFFGFAGREALGEVGDHPVEWYKRRGNADNLLVGNDFSYAPAHGIENTFSFGNQYLKNRMVGNAICGVWAGYLLSVQAAGKPLAEMQGALVASTWQATFFQWPTNTDPRKDLEGYRKLAEGPTAVSDQIDQLSLKYGMRGPSELGISPKVTAARLGQRYFGMVARTRLPLTKGTWEFTTLSNDGVRVRVNGKPVIENWAWHGPTRDTGKLTLETDQTVAIEVEHFPIDGYAVLDFSVQRWSESVLPK